MQQLRIGDKLFSKILCGTNAIYGRSHFSSARDTEYRERFTQQDIYELLLRCHELGIDTVETSANEMMWDLLHRIREGEAIDFKTVGSTRIDATSKMKSHEKKLAFLLEQKAQVCVIHSQLVDGPRKGEITGLRKRVERIHQAGLLAAVSTHCVDTVRHCEEADYGLDTYLFPLNISGYVFPGYPGNETVAERVAVVNETPKPFILMKTLAAGRVPPDEGLAFIAENAKPDDIITVGFGSIKEAEETIAIAARLWPDV